MGLSRVAVVLNGKSGALLAQDGAHDMLERALRDAGLEAVIIPPDAGTLPERIDQAVATGAEAVLVAGGDGTVACAAQALLGQDVPLGILPFGTMNLLAKDLHLPIGDLERAMQIVAAGQTRAIDVGEVNGHVFLCASMLGLPATLGRTREETRGGGVRLWTRMARAALRLIRRGQRLHVRLALDGRARRVSAASLTVTVSTLDDTTGRTFGRAQLDRGAFGVYLLRPVSIMGMARLLLRILRGRWRQDPALSEREAHTVEIGSRLAALHVMNDGELRMLTPPLRYTIHPGGLRVLAP